MNKEDNKEQRWMMVAFVVSILIFAAIGFAIGYISIDNGCNNNPLVYGVRELNELNEDNFICSCRSMKGLRNSFEFNGDTIWQDYP